MTASTAYIMYLAFSIHILATAMFHGIIVFFIVICCVAIADGDFNLLVKCKKFLTMWIIVTTILFLVPDKPTLVKMLNSPSIIQQIDKRSYKNPK